MAYKTRFDGNTDITVTLGKEGDPTQVEGFFLGTKETPDTGYGPGKLHIFQTKDGNVGVWGKTNLNRLLSSEILGHMCLVQFTGMIQPKKKGRRPAYGFKVQHDPDNTTDVSGLDFSAAAADDYDDGESDVDAEETPYVSEPAPSRPAPPRQPAPIPDADRQAKVQALLNRSAKR